MNINLAVAINKINLILEECESLYDVLSIYTSCREVEDILEELDCTDDLSTMAEQNDMKTSDLANWIKDHLESSIDNCRVFQESGITGWPVVQIGCLDKVFYLDWITD